MKAKVRAGNSEPKPAYIFAKVGSTKKFTISKPAKQTPRMIFG